MPPEFKDVLMHAIMNPVTLLAGYWLGRKADQVQKLVIAAFIAAIGGTVYTWLRMKFGFTPSQPRLLAGILVASAVMALIWSGLGYWTRQFRKG